MNKLEDLYPEIISSLMKYIDRIKVKDSDKQYSLIEITMDFARHEDIDVEIVGDAIRSDVYFMSFFEKDCLTRNIILSDKEPIEDW